MCIPMEYIYTSIIGTQGSASCKSGHDEMYKQHSILHDNSDAGAPRRLELLYNICRCTRRSGGNDDEGCKSKCMRPLEASCASNYAGTVDCFSISGLAQLYIYSFDCADQQDTHIRTHRQTNRQTDRHTHIQYMHRHCHPSSCSEAAVDEK